jgi:hypothetical protein
MFLKKKKKERWEETVDKTNDIREVFGIVNRMLKDYDEVTIKKEPFGTIANAMYVMVYRITGRRIK